MILEAIIYLLNAILFGAFNVRAYYRYNKQGYYEMLNNFSNNEKIKTQLLLFFSHSFRVDAIFNVYLPAILVYLSINPTYNRIVYILINVLVMKRLNNWFYIIIQIINVLILSYYVIGDNRLETLTLHFLNNIISNSFWIHVVYRDRFKIKN